MASMKYKAKVNKVAGKVKMRQAARGVPVGDTIAKNRAKEILRARQAGRKAVLPQLTKISPR